MLAITWSSTCKYTTQILLTTITVYSAEDNLKDSLMQTVNILNSAVKQFDSDVLLENETELEENETSRIMPKLFFCSKYATAELKQKHKLKYKHKHKH